MSNKDIKLIWNGGFSGNEYLIKIDGQTHTCLDSHMHVRYNVDREIVARKEAEQWLLAHGYTIKDFDVYKEPFKFGGCL